MKFSHEWIEKNPWLLITLIVNGGARWLVWRTTREYAA